MIILLIAIGGAAGSVLRYLTSLAVYRVVSPAFPWSTFGVNVLGCLVFGLMAGAAEHRHVLSPEARAFLLVGVLGGFTTFSTFGFESVQLLRDGQFLGAALNIVGQVVVGLAGLWAGLTLAR